MNPLLWKALRQSRGRRGQLNIFWIWALAAGFCAIGAVLECGPSLYTINWAVGLSTEISVGVTILYVCFASALTASTALDHERQSRTLESLLMLPLSDAEVHRGLLLPGQIQIWREMAFALPWVLVWVWCGRPVPLAAVICAYTLAIGWFCAQLGLWISTWATSARQSSAVTTGLILGMLALRPVLLFFVASHYLGEWVLAGCPLLVMELFSADLHPCCCPLGRLECLYLSTPALIGYGLVAWVLAVSSRKRLSRLRQARAC